MSARRDKLSTHKKKAWIAFSLYIRTRDCLKTTGGIDVGLCATCQRSYPLKLLQAGHFIDGRSNAVLFSEEGTHAQCYACNVSLHGNKIKYWVFMEDTYGRNVINRLIRESHQTIKYITADYDSIAADYNRKTERLLANV